MSISHRNHRASSVHPASSSWVESITFKGFKACVRNEPTDTNHDGTLHLEWLAYQTVAFGLIGEKKVDGWAGGVMCSVITFEVAFTSVPLVQATVNHRTAGW